MDYTYEAVLADGLEIFLAVITADTDAEADAAVGMPAAAFANNHPGQPFEVVEHRTIFRTAGSTEWRGESKAIAPLVMIPERWRRTTLLRQVASEAINRNPAINRLQLVELLIEAVNASEVGNAQGKD